MNPAVPPPPEPVRASRPLAFLGLAAFLAGLILAVLAVRSLPPAPLFSPQVARATYWRSYETAYFASLRAFEQPIRDLLDDGLVPVVVFGDSTIRGTGATGTDIWTRVLERKLQERNRRVRVLNYSQNAGDLMGLFLYHHLQQKFPQACYIVQWHFSSEAGMRHPFHYWLTSEIALRDGNRNPAVARSFKTTPVTKPEERYAFALAGLNILTHYLEAGNWVRYRWLGRPFFDWDRVVRIQPLATAADTEVQLDKFVFPGDAQAASMRKYFLSHQTNRAAYVLKDPAQRQAYFTEMFPAAVRSHLLLLTLDFNPYYAPHHDEAQMATWRNLWVELRKGMAAIPSLNWVSLTGSAGDFGVDDYVDVAHLTVSGQRKLADAVAEKLLAPGGWFDPAAPDAVPPAPELGDRWVEMSRLPANERLPLQIFQPRPVRFFSQFGLGVNGSFLSAHPETRLVFQAAPGRRLLKFEARFDPGAFENLPVEQATDGVQVEIALLLPGDIRQVVYTRLVTPATVATDRGLLSLGASFVLPADAEIEISVGPGPHGGLNRDWFWLGNLSIE